MRRRRLLLAPLALGVLPAAAEIRRGRVLVFPRDHGAHPEARTEWWYATGWLTDAAAGDDEPSFGFQVTFFRSRTGLAEGHASRFAARQLVFAHAAVTDLAGRALHHDQRIARAGFGIAEAAEADTDTRLRDWRFVRAGEAATATRYRATVTSDSARFAFVLDLAATQPLLLQGDAGFSRKGPREAQASHYYSQPQLEAAGRLVLDGRERRVRGRAWLDHEWSDEILDAEAVGWDWIGINLLDGGALTAFRLRRADGSTLWAGGSHRPAGGPVRAFGPDDVDFTPQRRWRSPATRADYPVEWAIRTPVGRFRVQALLDAQELDGRGSTGSVYWEGLSELLDAGGRRAGLGYLEMTGYADRLRL